MCTARCSPAAAASSGVCSVRLPAPTSACSVAAAAGAAPWIRQLDLQPYATPADNGTMPQDMP